MAPRLLVVVSLGLFACAGEGQDITVPTTPTATGAPDVAGMYDVTWQAVVPTDCEADDSWVSGTLSVSGPAAALSFDFEEFVLTGAVDATFSFDLGGLVTGGRVDGEGIAFLDGDRWMLEGDLTLLHDAQGTATLRCTFTGTMSAMQTGVGE